MDVALVEVWQGADAVLSATAYAEQLVAAGGPIRELVIDPMRFSSEALRLERAHGLTVVEWPQSETRMTICSERLHGLVVEQRLRHPGVAELDRHVANAVAKPTPRGWRLVKSAEAAQIDAAIALAMPRNARARRLRRPRGYSGGFNVLSRESGGPGGTPSTVASLGWPGWGRLRRERDFAQRGTNSWAAWHARTTRRPWPV